MAIRKGPKKNSCALPAWFDIQKYKEAKNFTALQWYQQLSIRLYIEGGVGETIRDCQEFVAPRWKILKEHPLNNIQKFDRQFLEFAFGYDSTIPNTLTTKAAVYHATNMDVHFAHLRLPEGVKNLSANYDQITLDPLSVDPKVYEQLHAPAFTHTAHPLVRVNIDLPIEIIVKQFSDFIKSVRRSMHLEVDIPFKKGLDFKSWYRSGLLPYLDLKIWEKETGKSFVDSAFVGQLSNILSDTADGKILVTTKRHIEQISNEHETLRLLLAQAASESLYISPESDKIHIKFSD